MVFLADRDPNIPNVSDLRTLIGARILDLRKGHGLTQEPLGERAGVSCRFLGEAERGVGNPTVDWLESMPSRWT